MILVFAETQNGKIKKAAFEAVTYGRKLADQLGVSATAVTFNKPEGVDSLGTYGAHKVISLNNDKLNTSDGQVLSKAISSYATQIGASHVIVSHSSTGKSIAGRLAIQLNAGLVSGVSSLPTDAANGYQKGVFSGKATTKIDILTQVKVLSLMGNSFAPDSSFEAVSVENVEVDALESRVKTIEVKTISGSTPLPEAELVVSAGRGMKGPENWGIIEELAQTIGATTACSRPVADSGWRPHHEHVGQTGVAIRPNLYFAIGISGAIQHLAGVNNSKVIVVINKDPEAPFFKEADYGVVGDLFEVVPRLIAALK